MRALYINELKLYNLFITLYKYRLNRFLNSLSTCAFPYLKDFAETFKAYFEYIFIISTLNYIECTLHAYNTVICTYICMKRKSS